MELISIVNKLKEAIDPIYIISGKDDYLRGRYSSAFFSLFDEVSSQLNISRFEGNFNIQDTIAAAQFPPFGSQYRLIIWDIDSLANSYINEAIKAIKRYIDEACPTTILLLIDTDERLKVVYKNVSVLSCRPLGRTDAILECSSIVRARGVNCDTNIIKKLYERCNSDISMFERELDKLSIYTQSNNITIDDIEECIPRSIQYSVYLISDAVAALNSNTSMIALKDALDRGVYPLDILTYLARYYRKSFYAKITNLSKEDVVKVFKERDFNASKIINTAKRYQPTVLKKMSDMLDDLEYRIKIGSIDPKEAIYSGIIKLLNY